MSLFTRQISRFSEKSQAKMVTVLRTSCFDLFGAIILETPVDKGVLRNNWYAEFNFPDDKTTTSGDPSGSAAVNRMKRKLKEVDVTDVVYFANNLPYAQYIEFDGISGKAPQGMVRVNTVRWDNIVSVNARKLK